MFLDELIPEKSLVSHGQLGLHGDMGYTIIPSINGINYNRSLSAHASSILEYKLEGKFKSFHCYIGLNDSSSDHSKAIFQVICDEKIVYESSIVRKLDKITPIELNIESCNVLQLRCINKGENLCHSIWVDPVVDNKVHEYFVGPLNNSRVKLGFEKTKSKYAVILFATENVSKYLYAYLKTFQQNANLEDCKVYITCPDNSYVIKKIAKYFDAIYVPIEPTNNYPLTSTVDVKDVTYSLPRIIDAESYLISDIDILVMGDLNDAFKNQIGICRDFNTEQFTLGQLLESEWSAYNGNQKSLDLLNITSEEYASKNIINCVFITGTKHSITKLDHEIRKMLPKSQFYLLENNGSFCREQALINIALIRSKNYEILNDTYNYQLLHAEYKENKIIHLNGTPTKEKYKELINNILDHEYQKLKENIFQELVKDKSSVLNWTNIYIPGSVFIERNNFVEAKKIIKNNYEIIFIDLLRSISNIKIVLEICKHKDNLLAILNNESLEIIKALNVEYKVIGNDKDLTIVKLKLNERTSSTEVS
jgi:hypothetical protein